MDSTEGCVWTCCVSRGGWVAIALLLPLLLSLPLLLPLLLSLQLVGRMRARCGVLVVTCLCSSVCWAVGHGLHDDSACMPPCGCAGWGPQRRKGMQASMDPCI